MPAGEQVDLLLGRTKLLVHGVSQKGDPRGLNGYLGIVMKIMGCPSRNRIRIILRNSHDRFLKLAHFTKGLAARMPSWTSVMKTARSTPV